MPHEIIIIFIKTIIIIIFLRTFFDNFFNDLVNFNLFHWIGDRSQDAVEMDMHALDLQIKWSREKT